MISLSDPWLAAAIRSFAPYPVVADWLDDQGAAIADVLRLFAGTGPEFIDGLPLPALLAFARSHGLTEQAEKANAVRWEDPPRPAALLDQVSRSMLEQTHSRDLQRLFPFVGYAPPGCRERLVSCACDPPTAFFWAVDLANVPSRRVQRFPITLREAQRGQRPYLAGKCPECPRIIWSVYEGSEKRAWKRAVGACFGCARLIPEEPREWGASRLRGTWIDWRRRRLGGVETVGPPLRPGDPVRADERGRAMLAYLGQWPIGYVIAPDGPAGTVSVQLTATIV